MNILITRPEKQSSSLAQDIRLSGYSPLLFPTLTIKKLPSNKLDKNTSCVIFTSVNAVDYGYHLISKNHKYKILAIGIKTALKLQKNGINVDFFPKEKPSSKSLLAMPQIKDFNNENITIIRGLGGVETLKKVLSNNNNVSYIEVYKRIKSNPTIKHIKALNTFLSETKGIIIITSIGNLTALLELTNNNQIFNYPVITLSNRIKNEVINKGFNQCIVSKDINNTDIIKSIISIS